TDDRRRDGGIGEHPGQGETDQRDAGLVRDRLQRLDGRELALVPVAVLVPLRGRAERESRTGGGARVAAMLARQQPAGDRVVGDDGESVLAAERQQFALDLPEEQVVARLYRLE